MTNALARIAIVGVPSPLMSYVSGLVRSQMAAQFPTYTERVIDSLEAACEFKQSNDHAPTLIISHFPNETLIQALIQGDVPALVVIDTPEHCVRTQTTDSRLPFSDALKVVSHSASLSLEARLIPRRLLEFHLDPPRALSEIRARVFSFLSEHAHLSIHEHEEHSFQDPQLLEDKHGDLTVKNKRDVMQVCGSLWPLFLQQRDIEITWPYHLFYDGSALVSPADSIIDLTGPARCLYYGPYLHLPRGHWKGELNIGFSLASAEIELRVEVFSDHVCADFVTTGKLAGMFGLPVSFEISDPSKPIQFRIFLEKAQIDGHLGLAGAQLRLDQSFA